MGRPVMFDEIPQLARDARTHAVSGHGDPEGRRHPSRRNVGKGVRFGGSNGVASLIPQLMPPASPCGLASV